MSWILLSSWIINYIYIYIKSLIIPKLQIYKMSLNSRLSLSKLRHDYSDSSRILKLLNNIENYIPYNVLFYISHKLNIWILWKYASSALNWAHHDTLYFSYCEFTGREFHNKREGKERREWWTGMLTKKLMAVI